MLLGWAFLLGASSWKAPFFTLSTAHFSFTISVFTAAKLRQLFPLSRLWQVSTPENPLVYSHSHQTFTPAFYHLVSMLTHYPMRQGSLSQLRLPIFPLQFYSFLLYLLLTLPSAALFSPLLFHSNVLQHSTLPTASRISKKNGWLYTKTVNFMLLLYIWISREDEKHTEVKGKTTGITALKDMSYLPS